MHLDPTSQDTESVADAEGTTPVNSAQLQSHVDLIRRIEWNTSIYFVDRLASLATPSYTRLDTGLAWRCTEGLSLSIMGQNLLRDHHLEFVETSGSARSTLIKRGAYVKFAWQF
jgi:hypothetical protein